MQSIWPCEWRTSRDVRRTRIRRCRPDERVIVRPAIHLPAAVQRHLNDNLQTFLYGCRTDFDQPPHEPALLPPNSVSWRIWKNPISLFAGGTAAVILELAEPAVRAGVWEHS